MRYPIYLLVVLVSLVIWFGGLAFVKGQLGAGVVTVISMGLMIGTMIYYSTAAGQQG